VISKFRIALLFRRDLNLERNYTVIGRLEEEVRQKDAIIRDQSDTINEYR
jgi:hypothetical protein